MEIDLRNKPLIAARVFNRPLLLDPSYARVFIAALAQQIGGISGLTDIEGNHLDAQGMETLAAGYVQSRQSPNGQLAYEIEGSVAIIRIFGTLVQRSGNLQPYSGMTGYNGIVERMRLAQADQSVRGVMMVNSSPGGDVSGCFDTVRTLRKLAQEGGKPVWAISNDMACSACYAVSTAASRRLVTDTSMTGSIGVVMAHTNLEKLYQDAGVEVTLIHSGAHKIDGNPYQALPAEVRAKWQVEADELRLQFATLVADATRLSVDEVLATEAAVYNGQAAVDAKLADEMVNGYEAVAEFNNWLDSKRTGRTTITSRGLTMDEEQQKAAMAAEKQAAAKEAAQAEKTRLASIGRHQHAATFPALTQALQFDTELSADVCGQVLDAAAVDHAAFAAVQVVTADENPATADLNTPLDQAMAAHGTKTIPPELDDKTEKSMGAQMKAARAKHRGHKAQ